MVFKSLLKTHRKTSYSQDKILEIVFKGMTGRNLSEKDKRDHLALLPPDLSITSLLHILMTNLNPYPAPRFVPPGHHYSPITRIDEVEKYLRDGQIRFDATNVPGVQIDKDEMSSFWDDLQPHLSNIPFKKDKHAELRYKFDNGAYSWGDGSVLHAIIMHARPRRIIEIGSGWSSICTLDTLEMRPEQPCEMTVIEPFPELMRELVDNGRAPTRVLGVPVQSAPLELFDELEENDILFIDSTHVVKTGSDVFHELFEILPRLKSGVLVHFHDIFWPFEYSKDWSVKENRSWNELYFLRAFLTGNNQWKIIFFNDFFAKMARPQIEATYPDFLRNPGGAFWLRKVSV